MANFVETATLRLLDDSSASIAKINRSLRSLRTEAKRTQTSLRRSLGSANVNVSGINRLTTSLNRAIAASQRLNATIIGPKSNASQLNRMAATIDRINRGSSRASSRLFGGMVVGQSRPSGQRLNYSGGRVGNIFGLDVSPLRVWQASFIYRMTAGIENAIINGFKQGTSDTAFTEARQRQLGYTDQQRASIDSEANRLRAIFPYVSLPQIRGLFSELGPILGADPLKAAPLVEYGLDYQAALRNMGISVEQSGDGLRAMFRALDTMNRVQDDTGLISSDLSRYVDVLTRETIRAGADIKPGMIATAAIFARTTGKTLTPEGFRTLLINLENMGRIAGSSMNRFVESFTGNTVKKALAAQEEWGLITTKLVRSGQVGSKGVGTLVRDTVVGEELLRQDPNAWVVAYLIPELKKRGVDLSNVAQTASALSPLFGTVVGKDMAVNLVSWQAELKSSIEASNNIQNALDRRITAVNNPVNALVSVSQSLQNAFGELGNAITKNAITPLYSFGSAVDQFANWVRGDTNDPNNDRNAQSRARAVLGLGGIGLAAGVKYGLKSFDGFGLKTSAVALNTAATNLNIAAARLGTAGLAGAAAGAAGGAGALAAGAAAGGLGRRALSGALKGAGAVAAGALAGDALRAFDPGGNLWGATSAIDQWTASLGYSTGRLRTFSQLLSSDAQLNLEEAEQQLLASEERRQAAIDERLKAWQDSIKAMNLDSLRFAFPAKTLNDILWKEATTIKIPPELQTASGWAKLIGEASPGARKLNVPQGVEDLYRAYESSGMSQFANNIDGLPTSIDGLSETMKALPTGVESSIRASGDGFGQAFLAYASQFGAAAAAALNAGFIPPALSVNPAPVANTGTNTNAMR